MEKHVEKSESASAPKQPAIQGLRGLAILLVLLCHMNVPLFANGYVGVDIFFAISGFLITRNMAEEYLSNRKASKRQGWISFVGFYARRARRILPAAYAVLAITVSIWAIWPPNSKNFSSVIDDAVWTSFFLANLNFISQATTYFGEAQIQSPLLHYWSLAVEEQFYLFWPVFFMAVTSTRGFKIGSYVFNWKKRLQLSILLLGTISFVVYASQLFLNSPSSYFSAIGRFWEFGLGAFFALLTPEKRNRIRPLNLYLIVTLVLFCFIFLSVNQYRMLIFLPVFFTSLFLYHVDSKLGSFTKVRFLENRLMLFLGRISFSLYLVHWPLIVVLEGHGIKISSFNLLWFIPVLVASSFFIFKEFESRFMKLDIPTVSKRSAARRTRYFPLNAGALKYSSVIIFTLIFTVNFQQGLKQPFIIAFFQPEVVETWNPPLSSPSNSPSQENSQPPIDAVNRESSLQDEWESKISYALRSNMVPSGIQPNLSQLDSERMAIWKTCLTIITDNVKCNFGNADAPRKVFVLGDSYALSNMPMIAGAFSGPDTYVIARNRGQCMIPNVETINVGKLDTDCSKHREQVNAEIRKEKPYLVIGISLNSNKILGNKDDLIKGMKSEYLELVENSEQVLIIGETPFTADPRICLSPLNNSQKCIGNAASRSEYRELTKTYAEESGAHYLDITNWMCMNSRCPVIIDNTFVTWDGGHLTRKFSEKLAPLFKVELQRIGIN
jgi:peptidoglycan/LPS O-acetylase OafA/YrhL